MEQFGISTQLIGNISLASWSTHASWEQGVSILSISNDGRLLVGSFQSHYLFIYRLNDSQVTTINIDPSTRIRDAVWTCQGDIVYIYDEQQQKLTVSSRLMVRISSSNALLQHYPTFNRSKPNQLSACFNDVIYMFSLASGVFRSEDDGHNWASLGWLDKYRNDLSILFRPIDNYTEDLWLLESNNSRKLIRSLLSLHTPKHDGRNRFRQAVTTSRNVTIPISNSSTGLFGKMALSNSTNAIFMLDINTHIVHVLSASDEHYVGQLNYDFSKVFADNNTPCSLAFCTQSDDVMYVGHKTSLISVFKLKYKTF